MDKITNKADEALNQISLYIQKSFKNKLNYNYFITKFIIKDVAEIKVKFS